jgi:Holliday junction resolvase YEN1
VHADVRSIYKEIGPGKRVALSKLAVEKFEETGRPLRIAIDTSIWLFQIQASKGMRRYALRITRETDSDRWH